MNFLKAFSILIFFGTAHVSAQGSDSDYLVIVYNNDSSNCGYASPKADTLIPVINNYCFRDTIWTFGIVSTPTGELNAYSNKGEFLYEVFNYDNGPDYVSDGMFRIVQEGLIGYANETGEVVIPAIYDCAWPFEDGRAKVTFNCIESIEFEMVKWESEEWMTIDKDGKIIE